MALKVNCEEKLQQEVPRKLLGFDENTVQFASDNLSQSSCSTNIGDEENILERTEKTNGLKSLESFGEISSFSFSNYKLRNRDVLKTWEPKQTVKQRKCGIKKLQISKSQNSEEDNFSKDSVSEQFSQESTSMLVDCYEKDDFAEVEMQPEMTVFNNNETSDLCIFARSQEIISENYTHGVETSVQTDFSFFNKKKNKLEKDMENHTHFVGCVIKLKSILASKKEIPKETFSSVITNLLKTKQMSQSVDKDEEIPMTKETAEFILRSSNVEKVFNDTVKALFAHLEQALKKDLGKMTCCWKNSVYETAVDILNQALDREPGIRKMADVFLSRIIDSFLEDDNLKNLARESKTIFVTCFCKSVYLSYSAINYTISKLKILKTVKHGGHSSLSEKVIWMRLIKNTNFLLRILESVLNSFKEILKDKKIDEVILKKPEVKNFNVLEMWKKHWRQSETAEDETKNQQQFKVELTKWCDVLDDVLLHCINHIPVSSMAFARCSRLVKEILEMNFSEEMDIDPKPNDLC